VVPRLSSPAAPAGSGQGSAPCCRSDPERPAGRRGVYSPRCAGGCKGEDSPEDAFPYQKSPVVPVRSRHGFLCGLFLRHNGAFLGAAAASQHSDFY